VPNRVALQTWAGWLELDDPTDSEGSEVMTSTRDESELTAILIYKTLHPRIFKNAPFYPSIVNNPTPKVLLPREEHYSAHPPPQHRPYTIPPSRSSPVDHTPVEGDYSIPNVR
jgi:hypothetical protein